MITIHELNENYEEYLMDESKYLGSASSISFPEKEEEILQVIKKMKEEKIKITIQGGKTGITGGCVPNEGHIMNLSHMNHFLGYEILTDGTIIAKVEAGISFMDLQKEVNRMKCDYPVFWPPDPTEISATIGGIVSTNAKGPNQLLYGETKKYIYGIKLITSEEEIIELNRENNEEELLSILGTEGILGVISEVSLILHKKPEEFWGIGFFFETEKDALDFAEALKTSENEWKRCVASTEYLDRKTIDFIEARKPYMTKIKELPDIEPQFESLVLIELQGTEEEIENGAEWLMEIAMLFESDPDKAWAVSSEAEVEKLRAFRHAAAETTNLYIEEMRRNDKRITKLGTDMTMDYISFSEMVSTMREEVKERNLECVIFGHIHSNHIHVNLLSKDFTEYEKGKELIFQWMKNVYSRNGKIVTEHGIGKLKKEFYCNISDGKYLDQCKKRKNKYDKIYLFNNGNMF